MLTKLLQCISFLYCLAIINSGPALSADSLFKEGLFESQPLFGDNKFFGGDSGAQEVARQKSELAKKQDRVKRNKQLLERCDSALFSQMREIAGWMDNWVVCNHRFPEQGDEQTFVLNQLNALIPNNPYVSGSFSVVSGADVNQQLAERDEDLPLQPIANAGFTGVSRITLELDWSLTLNEIEAFSVEPPISWQAAPGTINVVSNNQYLFIVWGAGLDGKPIRDPLTGRVRMVVANYQNWNTQVMDAQVD